jgi:hypothetical protein
VRIEWDPLDVAVATLVGGVVRIHEGTHVREHSHDVLDMRWLADGPIFTIDRRNHLRWTRDGKLTANQLREPSHHAGLIDATIAAGGDRFVAIEARRDFASVDVTVETIPPRKIFGPRLEGIDPAIRPSTAISGDGRRLALGYITDATRGRGFAVFDIESEKMIDRSWSAHAVDLEARLALELDYTGARLAQALPDPSPALGVIRVNTGEVYPRQMTGGATAVAIDRSGELVAYAYREPPAGARGRLRFDYLDLKRMGGVLVDILDSQTLESELPDLVALAFSRDRRRLACLSSTGAIEIVPVP